MWKSIKEALLNTCNGRRCVQFDFIPNESDPCGPPVMYEPVCMFVVGGSEDPAQLWVGLPEPTQ